MHETLTLTLAWLAGLALGALFFGGLWWTIRMAIASSRPAVWFLGSLLLRTAITLVGFYFVSGGRWERMLLCLLGFVMARLIISWLTRPAFPRPIPTLREARHAT